MAIITFTSVAEGWLKYIEPTLSKNTYSIYCGYVKNYMLPYIVADDVENINQHIKAVDASQKKMNALVQARQQFGSGAGSVTIVGCKEA